MTRTGSEPLRDPPFREVRLEVDDLRRLEDAVVREETRDVTPHDVAECLSERLPESEVEYRRRLAGSGIDAGPLLDAVSPPNEDPAPSAAVMIEYGTPRRPRMCPPETRLLRGPVSTSRR